MTILEQRLTVADQDFQTTGVGGDHPDPEMRGGSSLPKKIFRRFGPQFGLKIRGGGSGGPGYLPWIRQWLRSFPYESDQMSAGQAKNEMSRQSKLQINEHEGGGGGGGWWYATATHQFKTNLVSRAFTSSIFNGQGLGKEVDLKLRQYLLV